MSPSTALWIDAPRGTVVALLGAESTGKTTLAAAIATALNSRGLDATHVPEYLREFCEREGRVPQQQEQAHIAAEQTRRIDAAAAAHRFVIADTSALMIAVYSDIVFGDTGLYTAALDDHACSALTLLTALDLPWLPDGLQRDGPQVREPVDQRLRAALDGAGLPYAVICGRGDARLLAALACIRRALPDLAGNEVAARVDNGSSAATSTRTSMTAAPPASATPTAAPRWRWPCERCGDGDCERHRP